MWLFVIHKVRGYLHITVITILFNLISSIPIKRKGDESETPYVALSGIIKIYFIKPCLLVMYELFHNIM